MPNPYEINPTADEDFAQQDARPAGGGGMVAALAVIVAPFAFVGFVVAAIAAIGHLR